MLIQGDARQIPLADASVHCVITSPPYLRLRRYDAGPLEIGQEETLAAYITTLVEVFREVGRILRPDGVVFLNLGDTYTSGNRQGHGSHVGVKQQTNRGMNGQHDPLRRSPPIGLKPKDLMGVPWRVAFALQEDGWTLRSDIIYAKKNPMPESVDDRPTRSHEYVFMLSKQARYFYDATAIAEVTQGWPALTWEERKARGEGIWRGFSQNGVGRVGAGAMRNKRSVWTISTDPYPGAHFATFPEALVEPCVLAGTSAMGCCAQCGAPWRRRRTRMADGTRREKDRHFPGDPQASGGAWGSPVQYQDNGWTCACRCDAGLPAPCVVFDP